jgi:hypothetical protein
VVGDAVAVGFVDGAAVADGVAVGLEDGTLIALDCGSGPDEPAEPPPPPQAASKTAAMPESTRRKRTVSLTKTYRCRASICARHHTFIWSPANKEST